MSSKKIGKFISELRHKRNISQEELSNIIHVDRTLISKWENGVNIPDIEMLSTLSSYFNVSIEELIYGEEQNKNNYKKINNNFNDYLLNKNNKYKRIKKYLIICILFLIISLFSFLIYYFVSTYNQTKVFKVNGNSEKYRLNEGLLIITKDKGFLKIGNINPKIPNISLIYKEEKTEKILYDGNPNQIVIDNTIINNRNINRFKNNLYLKINDEYIKLIFNNIYTNNIRNTNTNTYSHVEYYWYNDYSYGLDEVNK